MAIQVDCSCGKRLVAEDEHAGRKVRCPSCQGLVGVPAFAEEVAGYAVEQVRKCPRCKHEWPIDTVICIDCGHNFETGKKMRTRYKLAEHVLDVGPVWLGSYTRYRVFRSQHGKPFLNVSQKFLFLSLGSKDYDLSAYRWVLTDFAAGDGENSADLFYLQLDGPKQRPVTIFRSTSEAKFKELIDMVVQAGQLEIKRR
jgi:hypothetical protein